MICERFLAASVLVSLSLAPLGQTVFAENEPQFARELKAELPSKATSLLIAGSYRVKVDAGSLPAGQRGQTKIKLRNPEPFEIPIRDIAGSCGCTTAKLMRHSLPPESETDLVVMVKTPKRYRTTDFAGSITLNVDPAISTQKHLTKVVVTIEYRIEGLLCFNDPMVPVALRKGARSQIKMPFVSTVQTPVEELEVSAHGALTGTEGEIISENDENFILLNVEDEVSDAGSGFGKIILKDPRSDVSDTAHVILNVEERVLVSPRTLRFVYSEDEEKFVARGIVRIRDDPDMNKPSRLTGDTPTAAGDAWLSGTKINVTLRAVTRSVFRIEMQIQRDAWEAMESNLEEKKPTVDWLLTFDDFRSAGKSPMVVIE